MSRDERARRALERLARSTDPPTQGPDTTDCPRLDPRSHGRRARNGRAPDRRSPDPPSSGDTCAGRTGDRGPSSNGEFEPVPDGRASSPSTPIPAEDAERTVSRAAAAVDDLDAAVRFVENDGLEALSAAIDAPDAGECDGTAADEGRAALAAFRAFERAAGEE